MGAVPRGWMGWMGWMRWAPPAALAAHGPACQFAPKAETTMAEMSKAAMTRTGDPDALRDGEVAVELPAAFDASLYYIGRARTPWKRRQDCPKNTRESDAVCTVELDARWAQGLKGLETASHVLLLYWMDQARRDLVLQAPRHYAEQRGTFA